MLKRQMKQLQDAASLREREAKEAARNSAVSTASLTNPNQMVMLGTEGKEKRNWTDELERLEDTEIVDFIIEEKPPLTIVRKAIRQYATSLDVEDF